MGNCIQCRRSKTWAADDDEEWDYDMEEGGRETDVVKEKGVQGGGKGTEVKIKITKKELEEILRMPNAKGLSVQEVLMELLSVREADCGRPWRPALQSIPEVAE